MTTKKVVVQEVGLRDGLQSIPQIMPTEAKKAWIDAAYSAGIRHIEVASFVPPRLLPQMADAEQVVAHALTLPGLRVTALVPNVKGAENALKAGVHRVVAPISISEQHSLANVRKTPDAMLEEFQRIRELRDSELAWAETTVVAGLSTVFGCSFQGYVPEQDVCRIVLKALDAGADVIALGDTTGHATPRHVRRLLQLLSSVIEGKVTSLHFHDTRGMALANTVVALDHGIREFDSSLAGLGGCPNAPGATGNVATEDLVYMLQSMGFETDIDLQRLVESRDILRRAVPDAPLYGYIAREGILEGSVPPQLSSHGVQS
ncbi:hydroxymethylglutaryl-CoA lyase [Paraburkholderia sp. BL27I4N3]|uniref:hydroxymethylglutaryl-CoA lyase n=1 Tax=Paraburkholderia sp. BL27I4N3 TaxID=1938805 RepID=UPI000E2278A4|nr:hydroxymethylglutaryl-CoA lyase [Paraburkholderia sp. BL27I4N3]REE19342.1 hydroxymethylglutaryl-CoA lyase [Paraburkholderia sp. BL27I4N3]